LIRHLDLVAARSPGAYKPPEPANPISGRDDVNRIHSNPNVAGRLLGDTGATLVEYTLLLSLIAIVCLAALSAFGSTNSDSVNDSASRIVAAGGG
jgi:Flp pilus assembly pilin Flp